MVLSPDLDSDSIFFGQVSVTRFVFDHDSRGLFVDPWFFGCLIDSFEKAIAKEDYIGNQAVHYYPKEPRYHHNHCSRFPWCCQLSAQSRKSCLIIGQYSNNI